MNIVWFRRDLRTIDNTALIRASETGQPTVALFIATPEQWRKHHLAPIQADLIARRLTDLSEELALLNIQLVYREVNDFSDVPQLFTELAAQLSIEHVFANKEYEVNEQKRDQSVASVLNHLGASFQSFDDKCVFAPTSILNKQGQYFKVFTPFKRAWLARFQPPMISKPQLLPEVELPLQARQWVWSESTEFTYPKVSSEGWVTNSHQIIEQLRAFCTDEVKAYKTQRDFPYLDSTSRLSAYLAIGALSVRQCIARLYYNQSNGEPTEGEQTWLSELIWREFYQHLLVFEPKLSKGIGFVSWEANITWPGQSEWFEKWKRGETGYPIVDAAMKQLNTTGWMHNRLRMIVASFLTKDLHIDWRWGEAYFMSKLIDGDYAANNGGWQWCASTGCDGQPYFRIFNPTSQGEKFDPEGDFVKHWIPALHDVPKKWVHQPWNSENAHMLDYPSPIVDHKAERALTLTLYKEAKDSPVHAHQAE
ncbi:deoxyribodipyrimidine photo-lyase [Vibrio profundi]|uniref:deoxyribodipyrimidine photo-lyase n=1 Tax=Vibrio profundi TaxID=1774960 RepID=UPI0037357E38